MEMKRSAILWFVVGVVSAGLLAGATPIAPNSNPPSAAAEFQRPMTSVNKNPTYQLLKSLAASTEDPSEAKDFPLKENEPKSTSSNVTRPNSRRQPPKPVLMDLTHDTRQGNDSDGNGGVDSRKASWVIGGPGRLGQMTMVSAAKSRPTPSGGRLQAKPSSNARVEASAGDRVDGGKSSATTGNDKAGRGGGGGGREGGVGGVRWSGGKAGDEVGGVNGGDWRFPLQPVRFPVPDFAAYEESVRYMLENPQEDPTTFRNPVTQVATGFATSLPPLAMAEYLLLTDDFSGFEDSLADIVAIGLMTPAEAEMYRESVRLEYDALLKQETEADAAIFGDEYPEGAPAVPDAARQSNFMRPLLPPLAIEYPDYGFYGNPINGQQGPSNRYIGPAALPPPSALKPLSKEEFGEMLLQMLDSITVSEKQGSSKSSDSKMTSSMTSSSTSSAEIQPKAKPLEQQQQQKQKQQQKQQQRQQQQQKLTGSKSKDGAKAGLKKQDGKGKGSGEGAGKGRGGGARGGKQSSTPIPPPPEVVKAGEGGARDAEKELKSLASKVAQSKTKEANGTKPRRPQPKQQQQQQQQLKYSPPTR